MIQNSFDKIIKMEMMSPPWLIYFSHVFLPQLYTVKITWFAENILQFREGTDYCSIKVTASQAVKCFNTGNSFLFKTCETEL